MDTSKGSPDPPRQKTGKWIFATLLVIVLAGLLYVLTAAVSNPTSSDGTPLGGAALAFVQRTLRSSGTSPIFPLLAVGAAFLLGGLHSLTPGHNKTLVGTYLVGARARLRDAFLVGMVTAFSHTASAYVIGVLAVSSVGQIASTQFLKWIGLPSGVVTIILGFWLLWRNVAQRRTPKPLDEHEHDHHHSHVHSAPDGITLGGLLILGLLHGAVPAFDAIAVILVALSVQKLVLGVGLILAYSLGIGSVLVAVGALFVRANVLLLEDPRFARVSQIAPALAAGVVIVLGLSIVFRAWVV